ncbi:MAG: type II secretion system F family protein [Actinomycetota bacterium]
MSALLAAICFGVAAALAVLAYRQISNERTIRQRSLEQLGLRAPVVKKSHANLADRRTIVLVGVGGVIAVIGVSVVGPLGLLLGAGPVVGDSIIKKRAARQRAAALAAGLAPALQLLVDNLRVGRDLVSALAEVSDSADEPVASLFGTVVSEVRLGARVDTAFADVAEAEGDRHLSVIASAVGLNIEFGGNLIEILGSVIESLEEEDRLRRDIDSLTADGRLSSTVLLALPVITLIVVSVLSPGYASPLLDEPAGRLMSGAGVVLGLVGWIWLRALSNPEVVA